MKILLNTAKCNACRFFLRTLDCRIMILGLGLHNEHCVNSKLGCEVKMVEVPKTFSLNETNTNKIIKEVNEIKNKVRRK